MAKKVNIVIEIKLEHFRTREQADKMFKDIKEGLEKLGVKVIRLGF